MHKIIAIRGERNLSAFIADGLLSYEFVNLERVS